MVCKFHKSDGMFVGALRHRAMIGLCHALPIYCYILHVYGLPGSMQSGSRIKGNCTNM